MCRVEFCSKFTAIDHTSKCRILVLFLATSREINEPDPFVKLLKIVALEMERFLIMSLGDKKAVSIRTMINCRELGT